MSRNSVSWIALIGQLICRQVEVFGPSVILLAALRFCTQSNSPERGRVIQDELPAAGDDGVLLNYSSVKYTSLRQFLLLVLWGAAASLLANLLGTVFWSLFRYLETSAISIPFWGVQPLELIGIIWSGSTVVQIGAIAAILAVIVWWKRPMLTTVCVLISTWMLFVWAYSAMYVFEAPYKPTYAASLMPRFDRWMRFATAMNSMFGSMIVWAAIIYILFRPQFRDAVEAS